MGAQTGPELERGPHHWILESIAKFKGGEAQLTSANRLVYPDAFEGARADLVFVYRRAGLAQEVVLRSRPPGPESFGLEPATTDDWQVNERELDDSLGVGRAVLCAPSSTVDLRGRGAQRTARPTLPRLPVHCGEP
ncbi:MAG: hypothetical protein FJ387_00165 [Verrucomicrobia bacterium]|nr:hypothetical protein [Verrucomicrobiota bacterium]